MEETEKGQRSSEQVRRLLAAIGCDTNKIAPQRPPKPDLLVVISDRRIAIETTDYHGDEQIMGGSNLRKQEEKDAREDKVKGYWVSTDPLPGITKRIREKTKKAYDTSGADETWLAIFAGVPQPGTLASTFIFKLAVNCSKLNEQTGDMLKTSLFSRCYLHCAMTENRHSVIFCWTKESGWQEIQNPPAK